jgi:uncharacterized protein YbjT (DUF2867 family)
VTILYVVPYWLWYLKQLNNNSKLKKMENPRILVSGATGKVGAEVVKQLLEKKYPVKAMVRKLDARSEQLKKLGAEIVVADVFDTEGVYNAMKGTHRVFYLPVVHPYMIQSTVAFAVAAHQLQVEQVVTLTQWLSNPSHPSLLTRHHWLTDKLMPMIPGIASTIVNPGLFGEVVAGFIPSAAVSGVFPNFIGESKAPLCSNADMARVCVAALIDPAKHNGKTYKPTGPENLSLPDVARILTKLTGREIKAQFMSNKMFLKAAKASGISPFEAFITQHYFEDGQRGSFEVYAPTDTVYELTGVKPERFESIAKRYLALPESQPTFANKMKGFSDLFKIITASPYNIEKYKKDMDFPVLANPQLSADNEIWKAEHYQKN